MDPRLLNKYQWTRSQTRREEEGLSLVQSSIAPSDILAVYVSRGDQICWYLSDLERGEGRKRDLGCLLGDLVNSLSVGDAFSNDCGDVSSLKVQYEGMETLACRRHLANLKCPKATRAIVPARQVSYHHRVKSMKELSLGLEIDAAVATVRSKL